MAVLDPGARRLRDGFLRWQCRVRQMSMREAMGRPDDAIMPALTLPGATEPLGHIVTVMNKGLGHSLTAELKHMAKRTNDPAERREKAIQFLSSAYYQKAASFSDALAATFPPDSPGAAAIREAGACRLDFDAYGQRFALECRVRRLAQGSPFYEATFWHNMLFNPTLPPGTVILAFEPDWAASSADPVI